MKGMVPPDPETDVSGEVYAVVRTRRKGRGRFAAGCVETMSSMASAVAASDPVHGRHAARLVGPSKSSEGQYVYYLAEWIEPPK